LKKTEKENNLSILEMVAYTRKHPVGGIDLSKVAVIGGAIYYAKKVFNDTKSPRAHIALKVFVKLTLFYFNEWLTELTAWYWLQRTEMESYENLLSRLGVIRPIE
jgi:hypothetical protein